MLGLISVGLLGTAGYALHRKKNSNSYTVAKIIESAINRGEKNFEIEGYFDENEVARIMAEDGYNLFDYIDFGREKKINIPEKMSFKEFSKRYKKRLMKFSEILKAINNSDIDVVQYFYNEYSSSYPFFNIDNIIDDFEQQIDKIKRALSDQ